ncbi:hypothetical protein ACE6H2_026532 [Prunus campanulata]
MGAKVCNLWLPFAVNPCGLLLVAGKTILQNQTWCRKATGFKTYPMGLKFGYVILDTHWNNFYETGTGSWLPKQGLELTSFHFISFFCFTCMHMLLFSSSKADLQLQIDLPIQFPCSKAEAKCLSSFLLLLSLLSTMAL